MGVSEWLRGVVRGRGGGWMAMGQDIHHSGTSPDVRSTCMQMEQNVACKGPGDNTHTHTRTQELEQQVGSSHGLGKPVKPRDHHDLGEVCCLHSADV